MDQNEIHEVDPKMLARAYAVLSRVVTGVSKYTRDESDILSPMMSRLRDDGAKDELVIDAFLAVQRFLTLNMKQEDLFSYTHRLLFILGCKPEKIGIRAANVPEHLAKNALLLPWNRNPAVDKQSAAWFTALASHNFNWSNKAPKSIGELFLAIDKVAEDLWSHGEFEVFKDMEWAPMKEVETHDEEKHDQMIAAAESSIDKPTLH